ncbi:MAG: SprT family zinc-dependent metalloprotease [Actinomycetaceae bacterium]|nr:SprT family zinc-dependent metalloprotease [Actinomycetaceae bacterium]
MRQKVTHLMVDSIRVTVTRKRIKNMYLRVRPPSGEVTVSAPLRASDATITGFIRERAAWIREQQRKVRLDQSRRLIPASFSDGASVPVLNSTLTVRVDQSARKPSVEGALIVVPGKDIHAEVQRALKDHLRGRAWQVIQLWAPTIGRTPQSLAVRKMTTRWGSCNKARRAINLNLQLVYLPEQFLTYVLVHEMTHLWASGHGPDFYARMDAALPQWKVLRRQLNELGGRVL